MLITKEVEYKNGVEYHNTTIINEFGDKAKFAYALKDGRARIDIDKNVPPRCQFEQGKPGKDLILSLEEYAEIMMAFPYKVNPKCNALWIPLDASNRSVTLNLNHAVIGFDKDGYLHGENGNCGTGYRIILVPISWTEQNVEECVKWVGAKYGITHRPWNTIDVNYVEDIFEYIKEKE